MGMTKTTIKTKLTGECGAWTIHDEAVELPTGTEINITFREFHNWTLENPREKYIDLMCRCPGARNPAPYKVDVSALGIAFPRS